MLCVHNLIPFCYSYQPKTIKTSRYNIHTAFNFKENSKFYERVYIRTNICMSDCLPQKKKTRYVVSAVCIDFLINTNKMYKESKVFQLIFILKTAPCHHLALRSFTHAQIFCKADLHHVKKYSLLRNSCFLIWVIYLWFVCLIHWKIREPPLVFSSAFSVRLLLFVLRKIWCDSNVGILRYKFADTVLPFPPGPRFPF